MSRDYLKQYKKRSERRQRFASRNGGRGGWNIPRLVGAGVCLVGVIILGVVVIQQISSGEKTPDNVATRLSGEVSDSDDSAASGDAVATATPAPTPSPTPEHRKKAVALTFDDGPKSTEEDKGIKGTPALLDTLKEYDAHATFFVVGNRCKVDAEILKRQVAEGHELGNHTWDHPQLDKISWDEVLKEVGDTTDIVKEITGYTISIVRPPYGGVSDKMRKSLKYPMVTWDVDTLDWKIDTNGDLSSEEKQQEIFKNVKKNVQDGSIILMHDIHECSCEAAKLIIPWLQENDYDVLTVSELMERNGINMKNGKVYNCAR